MLKTRASAISIGKQRNTFAHTSVVPAHKEVDVVEESTGNGIKAEKKGKKKGIWGLFGWKN
jgi:hypothetical protein